MKVLAVGYACNPYGGSEPGVGWTAVCRIAKEHDVCVITDIHNRAGWEQGQREKLVPENVRVRFLRNHSPCSDNRFVAHLQSWLNYSAFNRLVLAEAKKWHNEENFDLCHQVTIAAWRLPSHLWKLPIPFVWGPVGGAGQIPPAFRSMLSPQARAFESLRDIQTAISSRSIAFRECVSRASVVFAANEETERFLRPFRKDQPLIRLPIASFPEEKIMRLQRPQSEPDATRPLRLFAGGNMEGRKGVSLALRALALAANEGLDFRYTVAGGGPEIPALQDLAAKLGLESKVNFHSGYQGDSYRNALHETDIYFLPSFRESTPVTLLEACFAGCYPVVADTSAQGEIVRLIGGHAVQVENIDALVRGLADALLWCDRHRSRLPALAADAGKKASEGFSSEQYGEKLRRAYQIALADGKS